MTKEENEIDAWFLNLTYIDKLSAYEGREKLGINEENLK